MGDIENDGVTVRELFEGQAHLYKGIVKNLSSMSLKCAVELGIADAIHSHGRPITLSELASALNIQPTKTRSLFHFMRLLVHMGLFSKTKVDNHNEQEEAYGLTPTSTLLIKDKPYCLSPLVTGLLDQDYVSSFQHLSRWFKGNDLTLWESFGGLKFWDYLNQNTALTKRFNQAMESDSEMATLIVKDCKPIFQGLRSLVDVGGGTGAFARIISEAFPGIKCTVLDLPHAVTDMPQTDNLKYVVGDMFQFIPAADAFFFKTVFHLFDDEDCLKLLKKCREAIASNGERGKVLIVDIVINEKEDDRELTEAKLLFDTLMNFNVGGRERTEQEWESLFVNAGFTHYKVAPIFGIKSLIEVYP
ncbi:O-methyltransferase ZRP4 [Citrus sinensis]|uniref:isoflavone 4'-O-methyltransferase-like n=1 Tax=Citrus sinensis TaxID=2711 RepID=UPI002190F44C|nr:isoflavone 4'-O-methyltransferase-like [Citrus sinensis]KAH9748876.1 O-methyltransferase ZRP4 [Citrus sinensis]